MAATAEVPKPQPQLIKPAPVIPVKIGFMGEQGTGKTTSASLLAVALAKQFHGCAPIHVTDPELGWQFLEPVIFRREGIKLIQKTVPTFAAMCRDLRDAEREGACLWAVELGKIWTEILRTLQKAKPASWGSELSYMWMDFVAQFLNAKPHCLVLGRIQDIIEEVMDEEGRLKGMKVGEGMKAGGQRNNFGYEPHMVIRMYREQRPRVRKGKTLEGEGRVIHRAEVTKDRTWACNGKVFRWADRDQYQPGDFKYVWKDLQPHFEAVQKTMAFVSLDTVASSNELIGDDGRSEYFEKRDRKDVLIAELHAAMELLFGGQSREDKRMRLLVFEHVFGFRSKEAAEKASLDVIERGVRIIQAFEQRVKKEKTAGTEILGKGELEILAHLDIDIKQFDEGTAEEQELPF